MEILVLCCFLLSLALAMLTNCQAKVEDSDGDGWDDAREAEEETNPNSTDSDKDGFSDPRDIAPMDSSVPDNTGKTPDLLIENEEIESSVKHWANNEIYGISRDAGDSIKIPIAKDALAQFIQAAMESALSWQVLHIDKSSPIKEYELRISLETHLTIPKVHFKSITEDVDESISSGEIKIQEIFSKGFDSANYQINVIYDLVLKDGEILRWEIDKDSSGASLETND